MGYDDKDSGKSSEERKAGSGLWAQKVMEGEDKKVVQAKGRLKFIKEFWMTNIKLWAEEMFLS